MRWSAVIKRAVPMVVAGSALMVHGLPVQAGQGIGPLTGDVRGQLCRNIADPTLQRPVCVALNFRVPAPVVPGYTHSGQAGTCSEYACDNTDPVNEQCNPSAYDAVQNDVYYGNGQHGGYVQNWYSVDCGTNYSRTVLDAPPCGTSGQCNYSVWVSGPTATSDSYSTATLQTIYSNQVYAPGHNCATAYTSYDSGIYTGNASAQAC